MLRLNSETRTHEVPITIHDETTVFIVKSMSIASRQSLLARIVDVPKSVKGFDVLLALLCEYIVEIKGYEDPPLAVLNQLEYIDDLQAVSKGVINFATLSEEEIRNLSSSSEHSTPDSATDIAASGAQKDDELASTTSTPTARS